MDVNIILFDDFETLDVFGPVEILGVLNEYYKIKFYSLNGDITTSKQGVRVCTDPIKDADPKGILFIPGGFGTRALVDNKEFIEIIRKLDEESTNTLTVCTGTAILARTGNIKGRTVTTNKVAYNWVASQDGDVLWQRSARWCVDGKYYTSSGVSAGMDMTLDYIKDNHSRDEAIRIAKWIEYIWNEDMENDPFSI